jgi:hypothetical protein
MLQEATHSSYTAQVFDQQEKLNSPLSPLRNTHALEKSGLNTVISNVLITNILGISLQIN